MDARGVRRSRRAEEEESYFISMADMMVGLLFVFIILLMYFAMQFQQKSRALSDAGEVRKHILQDLAKRIAKERPDLDVKIDTRTGVLRLPAAVLFSKGDFRLSRAGQEAVGVVARAMKDVLPCYTWPQRTVGCSYRSESVIDAIFVEGHTDTDALTGSGPISDNMDLSALRATNTFRAVAAAEPLLNRLHNRDDRPILSVSGYGPDRPVTMGTDEAAKSLNRRIDLRFLMETPRADGLSTMLTSKP
jgi:flagellar motor protein MotB